MALKFNHSALVRKAMRMCEEDHGAKFDPSYIKEIDGILHIVLADDDGPLDVIAVNSETAEFTWLDAANWPIQLLLQ